MSRIYVCPLSKVEETVEAVGAKTLVTLIDAAVRVPTPSRIPADRHLTIGVSDIVEQLEGHVLPHADHVENFLTFVGDWDRRAPMVIHCFAGVSRSTAAAFIAACALEPSIAEADFAQALRRSSPTATPNGRLVALADERLARQGRMTAAIAAIGRGEMCYEGTPFAIELSMSPSQRSGGS